MRAVIVAAGRGTRLGSITHDKPKCMVRVGGIPILEHQLQAYANAGISDIFVVAGFKLDMVREFCRGIKDANIKIIENSVYKTTNNMYSLYLVRETIANESFLLSNGDVVLDPNIIYELVHSKLSDAIACEKGAYNKESMKIMIDTSGYINDISKKIPPSTAYGNSIDVYKFSPASSKCLSEEISK